MNRSLHEKNKLHNWEMPSCLQCRIASHIPNVMVKTAATNEDLDAKTTLHATTINYVGTLRPTLNRGRSVMDHPHMCYTV